MGGRPLRRALLAATMVLTGLGFTFTTGAAADDPQVCGYVRYGEEPTSTVSSITYCKSPCGGFEAGVPPGEVNDIHYDVFVCVLGL